MSETNLNLIVDRQLPEFVREDYPTFVAFVEAYYEYMVSQGVDISDLKDLDKTMDDFVQYFKNELAVNLPIVVQDERLLLQHIKDHYLAKGSEGSYKLLFRLLFGKNVELTYPGESMLIPSDGRWNQEISVFVNVDYGDPEEVVGKLVEISSGDRVLSVLIDRKEELIGEVDRVKQVGENVYEMYLDKRFFGEITPNDKIRYLDEFQATILPATSNIKITQRGIGFRVGQVFELKQGSGTGALLKITETNSVGGIQRAELIKFGIGYVADFALSILSTNSVTAKQTAVSATATRVTVDTSVQTGTGAITFEGVTESDGGSNILQGVSGATFGGSGEPQIGDEIWTSGSDSQFVGIITAVSSDGTEATLADIPSFSGTSELYEFYNPNGDGTTATYIDDFGVEQDSQWSSTTLGDRIDGFEEQGYLNVSDVFAYEFIDSTYAGTILREFALNSANAQADSDEPAIIEVTLGALNRYPGYFESNSGFVSDSIFIQDSFYYQKFSYVLRINERLNKYKSAVRTMVHPAGMKLFGEFDISNNFDLSVALESLVKSLGIGLETDYRDINDDIFYWTLSKVFGDSVTVTAPEAAVRKQSFKVFGDTATPDDEDWTHWTSKSLEDTSVGTFDDSDWVHQTTKRLNEYPIATDALSKIDTDKDLSDSQTISDQINKIDTDKYVEDTSVGSWSNRADIYVNSYNAQDYWIYTEEYEGGLAETTTN
jgi:hypothetical protein